MSREREKSRNKERDKIQRKIEIETITSGRKRIVKNQEEREIERDNNYWEKKNAKTLRIERKKEEKKRETITVGKKRTIKKSGRERKSERQYPLRERES